MASQNFEPFHFTDLKDKIDGKSPILGALFLFFFFFFTLFFIYFLYICAHRRRFQDIAGGGGGSSNAAAAAGLDPAAISSLPSFPYGGSIITNTNTNNKKASSPSGAECAICLSLFQEGDRLKVLPLCRHGFHSDCVDKWLNTRSSCPLCRACVNPVASLSCQLDSDIP